MIHALLGEEFIAHGLHTRMRDVLGAEPLDRFRDMMLDSLWAKFEFCCDLFICQPPRSKPQDFHMTGRETFALAFETFRARLLACVFGCSDQASRGGRFFCRGSPRVAARSRLIESMSPFLGS